MNPDDLILIAQIGAPHGVKGAVRVKAFTGDAAAIGDYGPLVALVERVEEVGKINTTHHQTNGRHNYVFHQRANDG